MMPEKPWSYAEEVRLYQAHRRTELPPIVYSRLDMAWIAVQAILMLVIAAAVLFGLFLWAGAVVEAP